MPALPLVIDLDAIRQGLDDDLTLAARRLHSVGHVLLRRDTNNHVGEVVAVVAAIFVSMSLLLYWGIKKGGSCECAGRKK
ncbi:hypothetical protein SPBR_08959 [Sporothrix brasiliensis 5110]|uniref:Uncharacterized protein n=1 Tax=Sporothrix brasiliensis 5110 TaxID=1398154 RepID=A0A0C2F9I6_9PEZI|nr:uncharacterized protein SPBR_08959 [Sporothrix brasiliensis 5110]KIH87733.1 hypothetical protein SPBR_08959 [Sporothrix brasiliensis 5110]